jgi:hypothetical protein
MPSFNIKGEPIENTFTVTKQNNSGGGGGGGKMGCGGNSKDECSCCQTVCCVGLGLTGLILILKYTC